MAVKFVGKKRASITLRELGSGLKRMFRSKRFDGKLYMFANIATFNKKKADIVAQAVRDKGGSARITKEGKLFVVWERY